MESRPLAHAEITIVEARRFTVSDSAGRFRFDSLPAETFTFVAHHPTLDSIGFFDLSSRVALKTGPNSLDLASPSLKRLWYILCGTPPAPSDSGVLYGAIKRARDGRPLVQATVELTWIDLRVDDAHHVVPRHLRAITRTDGDGRYRMCGVPTGTESVLRVTSDSEATGSITLQPTELRVWRHDLVTGARSAAPSSFGTIVGKVTDESGEPIRNARILTGEATERATDASGHFAIRDMPAGTRQVEVRAVGMTPGLATADVRPRDSVVVVVELRKVATLGVVRIQATKRQQSAIAGFERRRKLGFGYFRDSSDIRRYAWLASAFRDIPTVDVRYSGDAAPGSTSAGSDFTLTLPRRATALMSVGAGGRCLAALWIDGIPSSYEELQMLPPSNVAALEVYPDVSQLPPEFDVSPGTNDCGAVVIWTKRSFP